MKIPSRLIVAALASALVISCEKPMSEAERNAQIEREVQQRLAAERQADEQKRLADRAAELEERERALAQKEGAGSQDATAVVVPDATQPTAETSEDRPPVAETSTDSRSPRSYDTFYRKLEPYGGWRETADYGYVWQPEQAQRSRDWRPYTDGRWAYTDAGWTWISDEPFGWATYHYGRWTRLRGVGWVWVPGDEWAPAWVSWRKSDRHLGWAPLPPEARFERRTGIHQWADSYYDIDADEYVFIPNEEIGAPNIRRAVIPAQQNVTIVTQTVNVTNITYSNTTIINGGPNYDELRSRSRQPLSRMRIQREYDVEGNRAPQAVVRGDVIAMMTPIFTGRMAGRPRNVGAPIREVAVERNWASGGNRPEAERARARMRSEATPPPNAPPKTYDKPSVVEATPAPAATAGEASPVPTAAPVASAVPTAAATASPRPTRSGSPVASPRPTSTPTTTATPASTAAATPAPTTTPTAVATATPTPVITATPTPQSTARPTAAATPVATAPPVATASPTATAAHTPRPRSTPPPSEATPTPPRVYSTDPARNYDTEPGPEPTPPLGGPPSAESDPRKLRDAGRNPRVGTALGDGSPSAPLRSAVIPEASAPPPTASPMPPRPARPVATPQAPDTAVHDAPKPLQEATPVLKRRPPTAPAPADDSATSTAPVRRMPVQPLATPPAPAPAAAPTSDADAATPSPTPLPRKKAAPVKPETTVPDGANKP